ncbi:MAG TPA: hypothetical protein VGD01_09035 [Candidatus Elarobacter sp.]|jgi:hypothetical protein
MSEPSLFAPAPRAIHPYRRSAFQIALLMFLTLGVYIFVWAFYVRRACAELLERDDQPLWKSVALVVPIFNLFQMFDLGRMIEGVRWRADPDRPQTNRLPWLGVSLFFIGACSRIPNALWTLGMLGFVPVAIMHLTFARAQSTLSGEGARPTPFRWPEWIVIVLTSAFWLLILVGLSVPDEAGVRTPYWWVGYVVTAFAVFALIAIRVTERRVSSAAADASVHIER